ncbi:uncharacterized protein M7BP isoform X2 [Battus philenor]|uniref:uncharacterized protein M7BP isoform X2 n=1 Tax=Battus philenor TaxID=42288 RepID=UPI0035D03455
MPDTLSLSTGVSLGLLAGIVSGVCYLVANGLSWPSDEESIRNNKKRSITDSRKRKLCGQCGGCLEGGVVPCICHHHRPVKFESGAWFLRQVQRALSLMPWSISTEKLEQIEEECEPNANTSDVSNELHTIREFLELLSAKLAGGPLERTRVAPLYDHPAYLPPPQNVSSASSHAASGASGAHAQLKRLVARVVEEASALPALARYAAAPSPTPTIESSTYEDLLATAILNKVIERYQTEGSGGRSSGIHSASASPSPSDRSSPRSLNSRNTREISPPLREEDDVSDWEEGEVTEDAVELPRRVPFPEFGGDIVHQDNVDRDFDEISSSDIQAVDGSWEENWLFQKKKIKTIQSVPVPMLVPNSNTEYRALIGDRDAEDTTDLSDNASDEEDQAGFKSDIKKVLDSKHVIGGKVKVDEALIDDFEPDSLMTFDETDGFVKQDELNFNTSDVHVNNNSCAGEKTTENFNEEERKDSILLLDVESGPPTKAEFNLNEEIHRSMFNGNHIDQLIDLNVTDTIAQDSLDGVDNVINSKGNGDNTINSLSRHERVGEYEETVSIPVQRYADSLRRQHFDTDVLDNMTHNDNVESNKDEDLIPGTIAYRERKKWLNYVEMPNNPYSPEAIQKRLSSKNASSLFDSLTSKSKDVNEDNLGTPKHRAKKEDVEDKKQNGLTEDMIRKTNSLDLNEIGRNENKEEIPSPKMLKHVLSEEIPQYKRYGRDYYIKEAKTSSGARKSNSLSDCSTISSMRKSTSLDNFDTELASPGLLIKQFTTIASNQHYTKFGGKDDLQTSLTTTPNNKDEILIEYGDINENTLFAAKPVITDDDTERKFEEILQSAYSMHPTPLTVEVTQNGTSDKSPNNLSMDTSFLSSSSLEDSIKIYNVQTGEIVKCKPEDKVSPRYDEAGGNDIKIFDKDLHEETNDTVSVDDDTNGDTTTADGTAQQDTYSTISEIEDILPQLPKVKELAKKFVSMENIHEPVKLPQQNLKRRKSKDNMLNFDDKTEKPVNKLIYMHSLTARSISKEFREELKLSMATPLTVPGGSKDFPEGIEEVTKESSRPGSPVPEPGTIKTKLAFFESLKSKFTSK